MKLTEAGRRALALLVVAVLCAAVVPALAAADGDPGSDVLVYQPLFVAADAHVSIADQLRIGSMLRSAARRARRSGWRSSRAATISVR